MKGGGVDRNGACASQWIIGDARWRGKVGGVGGTFKGFIWGPGHGYAIRVSLFL